VEGKAEMADRFPKYVFDLVDFGDLPLRVGQVEYFVGEHFLWNATFNLQKNHFGSAF
jgi:hypothetical protein